MEGDDEGDEEALRAELLTVKAELDALRQGTDEDVRKLLKQFTQDSRDMLACIQKLEKENQSLRDQLAQSQAA
ncbi:MAG: hypothetical protein R3E84_18725 [Pseudomonadales bacterium]